MKRSHPCRLVPRALWPRWDRPGRVAALLDFCAAIGADELMLFPTGQHVCPGWLDLPEVRRRADRAGQVAARAARIGLRVLLNDCCFIDDYGHTLALPDARPWPWSVDITGAPALGYRCLLAPEVRQAAAERLVALAASGVEKIFLDDEVRHDWHPADTRREGAHFCFCRRHLEAFGERIGRRITRAKLAAALRSEGPAGRLMRREWLRFKRGVLLDFIRFCRRAVHRRFPHVRLGQMTTFSHFAGLGGVGFGEQVRAWAGPLRPLCRPGQGWYGDHDRTGLVRGLAHTLWTIHCLPAETEVYSEIDWGSPWGGLGNSARMCADFQVQCNLLLNVKTHSLLLQGEGPDEPLQRRRLVRQVRRSRGVFDALARHIPESARRIGVEFLKSARLAEAFPLRRRGPAGDAADPQGITGAGLGQPPWPDAFATLARIGVPMTFDDAPAAVLTRGIALARDDLPAILARKNLLIDAGAAGDLAELGLLKRFGLRLSPPAGAPLSERLCRDRLNGPEGGEVLPLAGVVGSGRVAAFEAVASARRRHRVLSEVIDSSGRQRGLGIVLAERPGTGRRACLLPFDLADEPAWGFAVRKRQFAGILRWLGVAPVWVDEAFDLWPVAYRLRGDRRRWVGLINFGHDDADDVTCRVAWRGPARVRYVDRAGRLRPVAGGRVRRAGGLAIDLRGSHAVRGLDTLLLVIEPA